MEKINLNTIPGIEMYPIIHVSQGDVGRQFKINLYNDEGEVVLDGTESLSITGYKADGNVFIYDLPSVTGSELTISTEEQMTAAKGECICEISVVKDATKIGTANFIMQVEANPSAQGPLSTSALNVIDALLQSAQEDIETASSAASTATTAATNATNSASSAASSATSASSSATNAANSASAASASASSAASSASSASTSAANAATSETKIANMTVSAQSVSYNEEAEVVKTVVGDVYNLNFKIPKGQPMSGHEVVANPSGAATGGNLTKLGIDGVNYEVSGESGSTVTVTQIQSSGTKIAEIGIDGNTTELYAPTGSEVEANPSGTATGDLTKLGIDGTIYNLAGGSEVIANPSGASTGGNLTKLGIDGVNYDLPEGGGSTVTVTPIQSSGTKIAEIGIDGNTTDLYAPASGSTVVANPSGASTGGDLNKLGIDGVVYNLASGGGSEVIVNPSGEVASVYINTLKINGNTFGINNAPIKVNNKVYVNPSKLLAGDRSVIADFSGNTQTYNITSNTTGGMYIVFEVCSWDRDDNGNYVTNFFPLSFYATYVQEHITSPNCYSMQITTQPPAVAAITVPVNLGAVECSINCLVNPNGNSKIYNERIPILINGNAVTFMGGNLKYCVDNYEDGVIRKDGDLKLYVELGIYVQSGDVITVDYSTTWLAPTYVLEDTNTTTVLTQYDFNPILAPYPTFS